MPQRHGDGISGNVRKIGGMLVQPADAAACQHDRPRADDTGFPVFLPANRIWIFIRPRHDDAPAGIRVMKEVQQGHAFPQFDIRTPAHRVQQRLRDFFPGHVLMEQDAGSRMRAFPRKT